MNSNDGMVMWLLGGTGVFLLYSAYKNQQPQALLTKYVNGGSADKPISNYGGSSVPSSATPSSGFGDLKKGVDGLIPGGSTAGLDVHASTRQDISGTYYSTDSRGSIISVIPDNYQKTPNLYIPLVE